MPAFKHILLSTGLSDNSECLFEKAMEVVADNQAKLSVLHVVEAMPEHSIGYMMSPDMQQRLVDESKQALSELGQRYHIAAEDQHISLGSPKTEIISLGEKLQVDLIILGSHGHHGLGLLLGSTASSIIHGAKCDVLIVKKQQADNE